MNRCIGATRTGRACGFHVAPGAHYCLNHQPGADTHIAATRASRAAVRARAFKQKPSTDLLDLMFALHSREAIQSTLDVIIRLTVAARLDKETAAILVRACGVAARNFDLTPNLLSGPKKQYHDPVRYLKRVAWMLKSVDPVLCDALTLAMDAEARADDGADSDEDGAE